MPREAKTPRFKAFNDFPNCFGPRQTHKGKWQNYLSELPLTLEIGCGKAIFLLEMARRHPERNLLGIDYKADRMFHAAKASQEQKLPNIAFLQCHALKLEEYIEPQSVSEIWLTFPDPYPRRRQAKHRLSNRLFLEKYQLVLKPGGLLHLKTDNADLFDYSLEEINGSKHFKLIDSTRDLHKAPIDCDQQIKTNYERRFLAQGLKTHYLVASLK